MITNPQLPPKKGYVEVIDSNGNHVYKPTQSMLQEMEFKQEITDMSASVKTFLGNESYASDQNAIEMRYAVQLFAKTIEDDPTMMQIASVYPEYQVDTAYKTKDVFKYGVNSVGDPQLYQVLQDHTSSAQYTPDTATSLYKKIGVSDDGVAVWVQPLGATDAYMAGDIVIHKDKKWTSDIDNNVWEPGVYGWSEVEGESGGSSEDVPEFVQPTGADDAYNKGDQVMYNGSKYESLIDNNIWSPTDYPSGWKLVD